MEIIKEEKKRGRKPKIKSDKLEIKASPKKRGRKPKPKSEEDLKPKVPRKRGRKPKEKVYSISKPIITKQDTIDENSILHIPITQSDLNKIDNDLILPSDTSDIKTPEPYEPETNFEMVVSNPIKTVLPTESYSNEELAQIDDYQEKRLVKRNVLNVMYEFIDSNNREEWPKSTNIYCMWCCHPFDMMPCAIPEKYVKGKYYLSGCFCSFNCAAAYNFNEKSYNTWERYSLLNHLYKELYNTYFIKIKLAPPKKTLKIFGGFFTIEEFRKNFLTNNVYSVITPPMISLVPRIEENIFEYTDKSPAFIPLDENMVHDATLKLKRDKPLTNPKMTLESYMDLKIL